MLSRAGLVFVEATGVEAIGRNTPGCLNVYTGEAERALKSAVESFKSPAGATRIRQ